MFSAGQKLTTLALIVARLAQQASCNQLFSDSRISIAEAPQANHFGLTGNPQPDTRSSPARQRFHEHHNPSCKDKGLANLNTLYSGVYPLANITLLGHTDQTFSCYVDTGSADTGIISTDFQCLDVETGEPAPQAACNWGALYDPALGDFTNITSVDFKIQYFPENTTLQGSMGYSPVRLGGLTVPKQQVALVTTAAWRGADGVAAGLIGLAYPSIVSAAYRSNGSQAIYDPIFTTMVREKIVQEAVFTLAIDRVPRHTSPTAPAGVLALGGLVSPEYYFPPFTSVPIENIALAPQITTPAFYATTVELVYSHKNGSIVSGGKFQSIVDSGTSPNFVPTKAAFDINAQFSPPAVFNATLNYWTVDCKAKAPFAAFKVGGKIMPMDPRDMIDRSLNGLPGYDNVCFSAFADGGDPSESLFIIGEVWQRSYVVAYDVGRTMLHFAHRRPY